jgi:hypothetical protein
LIASSYQFDLIYTSQDLLPHKQHTHRRWYPDQYQFQFSYPDQLHLSLFHRLQAISRPWQPDPYRLGYEVWIPRFYEDEDKSQLQNYCTLSVLLWMLFTDFSLCCSWVCGYSSWLFPQSSTIVSTSTVLCLSKIFL